MKEHAKAVSLYNDIVVLHILETHSTSKNCYETSDILEDGIRTIRIKCHKSLIPKTTCFIYLFSVWKILRKISRDKFKPDIIHAHIYSAGVPAVIVGKLFKIPVVITEHFGAFICQTLPKRQIKKARFAMRRAKMILPVSDALRKGIELYKIKNRFQIVPNVVDTNIFHYNVQSKKDVATKKILLVSLLSPVKGVPYLFQALLILKKKRNDFFLNIIGDGPNRKEYENLALTLGIDDKVCFHGIKTKQEIAEFMDESHFFVLPSLSETFGVVLIEALASGLPVIATNEGGPNEIVTKDVGILVPPKDIHGLAEAIDNMLEHYMDYSPEKISQYAKDKFSCEMVGKAFDDIYRQVGNL
ncbi:MAG: glycosyltransferase [Sedimentisphaerales bacterium]|nr:glycosyltransferase [Sedimentisphaerales bacterium]